MTRMRSTLRTGETVAAGLAPRSRHRYALPLETDHFVSLAVEQRGLDVVVRLFDPAGELLVEVDSPIGDSGTERLMTVAREGGVHEVEIGSFSTAPPEGSYALAVETLRPATDLDRTRVDGEHAFHSGEALRRSGEPTKALEQYGSALDAARTLSDTDLEARALYRLGWMHDEVEQHAEAALRYGEAIELHRAAGERETEATLLNRRGRSLLKLGRLDEAEESLRRARELFARLDDAEGEAIASYHLGTVFKWTGRPTDALAAYERAEAIWEGQGEEGNSRTARLDLGDVYLTMNEPESARVSFERVLQAARRDDDRGGVVAAHLALGEALAALDEFEQAEEHLRAALALRRELDHRRHVAVALTSLGTLLLRTDRLTEAEPALEEALAIYEELEDVNGRALVHHKLGRIHHRRSEHAEALRRHEQAEELFRESGDRQGVASTRYGRARALYGLGRFEEAKEVLARVLDSAEELRAESASLDLRGSYLASRRHYWDLYVQTLMRQHEAHPGDGFDRLALRATESWRARSLLDLLAEAGVRGRTDAPSDLLARERRITTELDALTRARLGIGGAPPGPQALRSIAERETTLSRELDRVRTEVRSRRDRGHALVEPEPVDLSTLGLGLLEPGTVLLVYHLTDERSFAWTVSRDRVTSHVLPPRAEIDAAAREYAELLARRSSRAAGHRAGTGKRLTEMLLEPLGEALTGDRLAVIADGALHYLPFAALPTPTEDEAEDGLRSFFLVERFEIVHLPSASVLATLRNAQQSRERAPKSVAVIADPVFESADPRLAESAATGRGGAGPARSEDLPAGLRDAAERAGGLRRLPHTAEEARAILERVAETERLAALGFGATLEAVAGDALAPYRIVHFATHGLVDRSHPDLSGLVLSLYDREGAPRPGFLRLSDIYGLELGAELVVLSACETGLGREQDGEGLVGLTRGFLYAGAPRVVHSLWKVDDEGAAELMKRFYRHVLPESTKELRSPSQALREAQLSMLRDPEWSEPRHWAAFVFQGDWTAPDRPLGGPIEEADKGEVDPGDGTRPKEDLPPPEPPPLEGYVPPPPPPAHNPRES